MRICRALVLIVSSMFLLGAMAAAQERTDAQIQAELQGRIQPGTGISVQVQNGVATLTGTVSNLAQKQGAINMAQRTVGVRSVVDRIRVVPRVSRTDAEIEQSVRTALVGNLSREEMAAVNVSVSNGVVTLTGTLASSYPKQVAGILASWVPGVVDVRNQITVRPSQTRTDLQILADVNERFSRNPFIPATGINVSVAGGVVTLTGTVDNIMQVEQAESIASFTPGVTAVHNLLFVRSFGTWSLSSPAKK